jgi:baculoviral IAP repeat-containing protein 7/8
MMNGGTRSVPVESHFRKLGIVGCTRAVYPKYSSALERLGTFSNWPTGIGVKPIELVDCGMFYDGTGDSTICFQCGVGLRDWTSKDVPRIEHFRYSPGCRYMRLKYGTRTGISNMADASTQTGEEEGVGEVSFGLDNFWTSCCVCLAAQIDVVLLPCAHLCTCVNCVLTLKDKCPLCREPIQAYVRVFRV